MGNFLGYGIAPWVSNSMVPAVTRVVTNPRALFDFLFFILDVVVEAAPTYPGTSTEPTVMVKSWPGITELFARVTAGPR